MKKVRTSLLAVALVVALGSVPAMAGWTDGFEGNSTFSTVVNPDTSGDYDPDNFVVTKESTAGDSIQVTNFGTPGPASGSLYLRTSKGGDHARRLADTSTPIELAATPNNFIEASVYITNGGYGAQIGFEGMNSSTDHDGAFVYANTTGSNNIWGVGGVNTTIPVTYDAWTTLAIQVTSSASAKGVFDGTFDFYINGVNQGSFLHGETQIMWAYVGNDGLIPAYFDDVTVAAGTIPEPATLGLLVFGALLGIVRRVKRRSTR